MSQQDASLALVTVANIAKRGLCELTRSALQHGFDMHVIGADQSFKDVHHAQDLKPDLLLNFTQLYARVRRKCRRGGRRYYVFVDGFDVIAQGSAHAFLTRLMRASDAAVHFSGETYCSPRQQSYCSRYPTRMRANDRLLCLTKVRGQLAMTGMNDSVCWDKRKSGTKLVFPFLNSGAYAGEERALLRVLRAFKSLINSPQRNSGVSDQAVFHQLIADAHQWGVVDSMDVDRDASLFLNMCCPKLELTDYLVQRCDTCSCAPGCEPSRDFRALAR
jgi:hypothetical protein